MVANSERWYAKAGKSMSWRFELMGKAKRDRIIRMHMEGERYLHMAVFLSCRYSRDW